MKVGITILPRTPSVLCVALLLQFSSGTLLVAQEQSAPSWCRLSLFISTYPLELVEAGQWLQRNQTCRVHSW
jgi:hypothetical protein